MGQKVRPTGFRVGIVEDWRSRWYASKKEFGDLLVEDFKIRKFVKEKYLFAGIPKIEIERTRDQVVVHLFTSRPGIIIGRKGQEVDRLKAELEDLTGQIEMTVFPDCFAQSGQLLQPDRLICLTGHLEKRNGGVQLIAEQIRPLSELDRGAQLHLLLDADQVEAQWLGRLRVLLGKHRGKTAVYLHLHARQSQQTVRLGSELSVELSRPLLDQLSHLPGILEVKWQRGRRHHALAAGA